MAGERLRLGIVVPAFFYVPYWAAAEKGFYADAGLDVEIHLGRRRKGNA